LKPHRYAIVEVRLFEDALGAARAGAGGGQLKQAVERFALTGIECAEHLFVDLCQRGLGLRELLRAGVGELDQVASAVLG
jgi:hypothetical protein